MAVRGKFLGAALGALAGPVGAVVGGFIGHLYDRAVDPRPGAGEVSRSLSNHVPAAVMHQVTAVTGLAAAVYRLNRASGRARAERTLVAFSEIELGHDARFAPLVRREFVGGLQLQHLSVDQFVEICQQELSPELLPRLIALLFGIADAERLGLRSATEELLENCALEFRIPATHLLRLKRKMMGTLGVAYEVLGVAPTATDAELKRAYRTLAARFHPDRAGGEQEAAVSPAVDPGDAAARFRAVADAFERIQDARQRADRQ